MDDQFHVFVALDSALGKRSAESFGQQVGQLQQRARLVVSNRPGLFLALSVSECRSGYQQDE
jgi:hypothetical protein